MKLNPLSKITEGRILAVTSTVNSEQLVSVELFAAAWICHMLQ